MVYFSPVKEVLPNELCMLSAKVSNGFKRFHIYLTPNQVTTWVFIESNQTSIKSQGYGHVCSKMFLLSCEFQ